MAGMLANVIALDVVSPIIVVKAMSWLVNLNVSVKQLEIGRQKNYQHVSVSKIYSTNTHTFYCYSSTFLIFIISFPIASYNFKRETIINFRNK